MSRGRNFMRKEGKPAHRLAVSGRLLALSLGVLAALALGPARAQGAASAAAAATPAIDKLKAQARMEKVGIVDALAIGQRIVAVGERGMIFVSDDGGATWAPRLAPTEKVLTSVVAVGEKTLLVTGHGGVIAYSTDAGERWQLAAVPGDKTETLFGVLMLDAQRGIAYGAYASYLVTADGGKHWERRPVLGADIDKHIYGIARVDDVLVLIGEAGLMARSADLGNTWQIVESPYHGSLFGIAALRHGTLVAYGMRGKVYRSNDRGKTWGEVASGVNSPFYSATGLGDDTLLLTGKDGALSQLSGAADRLETRYTADRRSVARALASGASDWLLFGGAGVRRVAWNKLVK